MASPTPTPTTAAETGRAAGADHGAERSITDFLTDGSLLRLCAELSALTGVHAEVRDPEGRAIVFSHGARPYEIMGPSGVDGTSFPLIVGGEAVGSIFLDAGEPRLSGAGRESLERALSLLTATAAELCNDEMEMRHRVKELGALYRLNALLVRAGGLERVLEVALESALDVLGLDAGSIVLLREDADGMTSTSEEDLTLMASRNLSRRWLEEPQALSKRRLFDEMALRGEVVTVENLRADDRVQIPELVEAEGVSGFINAGLVFAGRPIGVIRLYSRRPRTFTEWDKRLLRSVSQQAAVAVQQTRLLRQREEEKRIQRQVQLAVDVQRRMLPTGVPNVPRFDIAARYEPSFELGGDFYDLLDLSGSFGLVVGDVVGKGVAAALLMSAVRSSLRAHTESLYDLDEVVGRVNRALCRDTRDGEFATLWYGVMDPVHMRLTYCSAGHEPTLVVRMPHHGAPGEADVHELAVGGMVVGVDPAQSYHRALFDLRPRDVIVAYTDGVTDAANYEGEKFRRARLRQVLLKILNAEPAATAARILELVFWELRQFAGLAKRTDDQTMVVVRVRE